MKLFRNGKSFLNYSDGKCVYWISWHQNFFGDTSKPAKGSDYFREQL